MAAPAEDFEDFPALQRVRLDALCASARVRALDTCDAYYAATQYDGRRYEWDGSMRGYANDADISPGWYVPLKQRRPSTRFDLAKLIVRRLTTMMLGEDNWPEITVEGDAEAEDYVKTLAVESGLPTKASELRNKGGRCGTAAASFAFVSGKPRVKVHNAKHMHVIRWADREEFRPAEVLECYAYTRPGYTKEGRPIEKRFYFARYWSEQVEIVWDPIPEPLAKAGNWAGSVERQVVEHAYGECPVYWCQNIPDSDAVDGASDFEGLLDDFDSINTVLSAATRGTVANVDPTLVIKDDPVNNPGKIKKGSGQAIFSKGGAEFLELKGDSIKTALELVKNLSRFCLDVAGVVIGDPEKLGPKAQSAAALRLLYQPMVNQCDILRAQYGKLLTQLLTGMLKAAKQIEGSEPGEVVATADGRLVQQKPTVMLPPRVEYVPVEPPESEEGEEGEEHEKLEANRRERKVRRVKRKPGQSEYVTLKWPAYFKPTMQDVNQATDAATKARGVTISDRTAVKYTAQMYGVTDVDNELVEIEADREARALNMASMMGGDDDDDDDDDDKGGGGGFAKGKDAKEQPPKVKDAKEGEEKGK